MGLICIEANRISLKNVTLLPTKTDPVMEVHNSQNISLDGIRYAPASNVLLRVSGAEKAKGITLTNTDVSKAKQPLELGAGVNKKVVTIAKK